MRGKPARFPFLIRDDGGVAEWPCSGLQIRVRRFDSDPRLQLARDSRPRRLLLAVLLQYFARDQQLLNLRGTLVDSK